MEQFRPGLPLRMNPVSKRSKQMQKKQMEPPTSQCWMSVETEEEREASTPPNPMPIPKEP